MWGLFGCLVLAKPSHTSVVELADPFGKNCSFVGAGYVKTGGPPLIGFIPLRTVGVKDLVVLNAALQHFDLGAKSHRLSVMGFLGLADSADGAAQYSPESDSVEGGDVAKKGIQ